MNLPIKSGTNPSTIVLVIMVTDRHTDKPMPVKTVPLFRGEVNCDFNKFKSKIDRPYLVICSFGERVANTCCYEVTL